jgi:PPOX class probable F420-dependent enzyme
MAARNPAPPPAPAQLATLRALVEADHQIVFITTRRDGTPQASLVRGGILDDPTTGQPAVVALVRGKTVKLRNLRRTPRATAFLRSGSDWATVEGPVTIIGPEDPREGVDAARLDALRREAAVAVARSDKTPEAFQRVMDTERRALVYVAMERVFTQR